MTTKNYRVFEDNAGGLHLVIFGNNTNPVAAIDNMLPSDLAVTLDALDNGEDWSGWDGLHDDPGARFAEIRNTEFGIKLIASRGPEDNRRVVYWQRLGAAGSEALVPASLDALLSALRTTTGLSTELPTYSDDVPDDTQGVWSWDESRLLIGACSDDLEIVGRDTHGA